MEIKKTKKKRYRYLAIAVFVFLLAIRFYPAAVNEYPKGSDSWYHLDRARAVLKGDVLFDRLNAGGTLSIYPPVFHVLIAPVFFTPDTLEAAKFLAPLLGFIAVVAFFLFARKLIGEKAALAGTFVFGTALEIVNTAIFLSPENLGFVFLFLALYFLLDRKNLPFVVLGILLALTHALSFIAFVFLAIAIDKRSIKLLPAPAAVFVLWFLGMKFFGAASQVIITNPISLAQYVFGFSPLFLAVAVLGMEKKTKNLSAVFIILTAYVFFAGVYPDRIFTFSIIPASLLAGFGLAKYWNIFANEKWVQAAMVLALLLASLFVFDYGYAKAELRTEDKAVLDWIKTNTGTSVTIAASWEVSGPWTPFLGERKNILGAFQESVDGYEERRKELDIIFSSNDKEKIIATMKKYNATYIYVNGLEERGLYPGSVSRLSSMFTEVSGNDYAHLYKI